MIWGVEDSTVLGLVAIIAGLGVGFGTALISFWLNYKTRTLGHQESLYQKQIEAYVDLSTSIACSLYPCYNFLRAKDLTPENRKEFEKVTSEAQGDLLGKTRMSFMILPVDVVKAVNGLVLTLRELPKLDSAKQARGALTQADQDLCVAIRKLAFVEPLTDDMLRAFGEHT